jgi:conjugative relaxase-like TrwC/TraI family protein
MATRSRGLSGSAGNALAYYKDEETTLGVDHVLAYHHAPDAGKVFTQAWGSLARELRITDGVTREQFQELWEGTWQGDRKVIAGRSLADTETGEIKFVPRTSAFDVFASTPKSVSELLIRSTPEQRQEICDAWIASLKVFVEHGIEADARLARTPVGAATGETLQQGSLTQRVTADIVVFPVVEYIARPTEEQIDRGSPPDPHLHAHLVVMSLCKTNDRWYTGDEYGLKVRRNSEFRDSLLMNEFTGRLEAMGYELDYSDFDRSRNGHVSWEAKGSDPNLRKFWSTNGTRAWEIRRAYEKEHGKQMTDAQLTAALSMTRLRKNADDREQDHRPVFEKWAADARRHGFDVDEIKPGRPVDHNVHKAFRELERRLYSASGLHRDDSIFQLDDVKPTIERCAVGLGFSHEELTGFRAAVERELIPVRPANDSQRTYYTTRQMLDAESQIEKHLAEKERSNKLVNLSGLAGTGKTKVIDVAVCELRGDRAPDVKLDAEQRRAAAKVKSMFPDGVDKVVAVSMAAATAERTGSKIHADRHGSIESITAQIKSGYLKVNRRTMVVIDEAGQLDTLRMNDLTKRLGYAPGLVMVGDHAQLAPIGAGGWYLDQLHRYGSEELTNVRRQRDQRDVRDYNLIRNGRAREGLENLAMRGRVHVLGDASSKISDVVNDYQAHRASGWKAKDIRIVADSTNKQIDDMNRFVQADRVRRGEVRDAGFVVHDVEQGRRWELCEGDQVIFLRSHITKGHTVTRNGKEGTIKALDRKTGLARIDVVGEKDERRVQLNADEHSQPVGLAYAQHAQKFQGHEVAIVQAVPGMGQTDAHSAYSMATRSTHETHFYVDKETHGQDAEGNLAGAWEIPVEKRTALHHLRMETADARTQAHQQFPDTAMRVKALSYAEILVEEVGEERAAKIVGSPGYKSLVQHLDGLERNGNDARSMLREAAREPMDAHSRDEACDLEERVGQQVERPNPYGRQQGRRSQSEERAREMRRDYEQERHLDLDRG